ncbi:ferric reductase-like transmembrane domain-containing protein [Streptomyces sp. NPDC085929]|uniref:ferric reductase-like transmembrane domain-containing protein n=1 Tax=Streptomyces sp. NPDC085929 TaxID=3365739 RepID=UPI0037D70581
MRVRGGMLGGAGVVALLWAAQVRPSARLDALFATAAHLTGLLAGYGVLVLLLLMARVPAVEHGVGADRLARWHALGGRHVLLLCFGHALFALCGYAAHQGVDVVSAVRELFGYPAVAAAFAGTALLAAVGVSSARAVRRRVSHETWRGVHLLVHLAASLAFGHHLAGPDLALAGWRFLQRRLWHTALPFSLSAPVQGRALRITVKALGGHSRRIRRLRPGTRVIATGPFGALTAARRTRPKVLLIAGGVGITPMRALFETLPGGPGEITLLYRAGAEEHLVLRSELEAIAAERQAGLHYPARALGRLGAPPSGSWGRSAGPAGAARAGAGPGRARRVRPPRHAPSAARSPVRTGRGRCIRRSRSRSRSAGPQGAGPAPQAAPVLRAAGGARPRWPPYRPRDGSRPGWGWPVCWPRPC